MFVIYTLPVNTTASVVNLPQVAGAVNQPAKAVSVIRSNTTSVEASCEVTNPELQEIFTGVEELGKRQTESKVI